MTVPKLFTAVHGALMDALEKTAAYHKAKMEYQSGCDGFVTYKGTIDINVMADEMAIDIEAKASGVDEPEIKYLGDVQRLVLNPGDTVVLSVSHISMEQAEILKARLQATFGDEYRILVVDKDIKIGVLGRRDDDVPDLDVLYAPNADAA